MKKISRQKKRLTVIYSLSTLPFFTKNPNAPFKTDHFELYTAALSSLTRRRAGNVAVMHCDARGAEYFRRIGLGGLWDEIKITIPDDLEGINPKMFWAAGKLFALKAAACPVLMLDTDFIAWQLPDLTSGNGYYKGVAAAHTERLSREVYPDISHFNMANGYAFDGRFNYAVEPLNTAFLYIGEDEFRRRYVGESIKFMKAALPCDDYLTYMVYAEQRLLAMLADCGNVAVKTVLDNDSPNAAQKRYTHTWGAKQVMRDVPQEGERFCEKCRRRIRSDFPEYEYIIELIERN